jgi:glutamate-5-semialdehyde dehydrogenase
VCAGNAVLLRGGTEIAGTNAVLGELFAEALRAAGLPAGMVRVLRDLDRAGLRALLRRDDAIDVLIPRGSPSLLDSCRAGSRIPMIAGGGGVNHQYVHSAADPDLAVDLVLDGALPEPEGCTALEAVLLDAAVAERFCRRLARRAGDPEVKALTLRVPPELAAGWFGALAIEPLAPVDLGREFLEPTIAVVPVSTMDEAIAHIHRYGSGHTESIVTGDAATADEFCRRVDAAAVVVNGSVRLHDGPTLGLGPEIAISTGRLHARGPVTLSDLMSHTWRIDGNNALRFRTDRKEPA